MANEELITTQNEEKDSQVPENRIYEKAEISHNYYLMTEKLETNGFYNILKYSRHPETGNFLYDTILAIDFGHGETTVCCLSAEQIKTGFIKGVRNSFLSKIKPDEMLKFNPISITLNNQGAIIPTIIGYDKNGNIRIGSDAAVCPEIYDDFKRYPGKEIKDKNGEPVATGNWSDSASNVRNISFKQLMSAYFKKLFEIIFNTCDNRIKEALDANRLLICVGCPTSEKWLNPESRKEYIKLVRDAIGNNKAAVSIVAESTAALMTGMLRGNHNQKKDAEQEYDIGKGIAIFDFGSSTIDFTYIKPGGIIITKSIILGGYDIDKRIFDAAVTLTGVNTEEIDSMTEARYIIALRQEKERYYGNGEDDNTDIYDLKNTTLGKPFRFNSDFMNNEVWGKEKGKEHPGQVLLEKCKDFINSCYNAVVDSYGCENVLISGGTGKVKEFKEIVEEVFNNNKHKFIPYKNTSFCVAEGLCLMKKIEYMGQLFLKAYQKYAKSRAELYYNETIKNTANKLTDVIIKNIKPVIDNAIENDKVLTEKDFSAMIYDNIINSRDYSDCMDKLSQAMSKCIEEYRFSCYDKALDIGKKIYTQENFDFVLNLKENININKNDAPDPYKLAIDYAIINLRHKMLAKFISKFYKSRKEVQFHIMMLNQDSKIQKKKLEKLSSKVEKKKYEDELLVDIYKTLSEDTELKSVIEDYFELNAEAILGKVMLYVYDDKPKQLINSNN